MWHFLINLKEKISLGLFAHTAPGGSTPATHLHFYMSYWNIWCSRLTVWRGRSFQNKCTSNLRAHIHLNLWIPAFNERAEFAKNWKRCSYKGFIRGLKTRTSVNAALKITKPSPQPKPIIWGWTELRKLSCLFRLTFMVAQYGCFVNSFWLWCCGLRHFTTHLISHWIRWKRELLVS